jgi:hypothetical protein
MIRFNDNNPRSNVGDGSTGPQPNWLGANPFPFVAVRNLVISGVSRN